mmetsp:Transcript_32136/g.43878  ORF Transcript_32136/g.43878 Transcript_32136/m.43878 type:complete len:93 (-) Transcript_32136:1372-1650(-)
MMVPAAVMPCEAPVICEIARAMGVVTQCTNNGSAITAGDCSSSDNSAVNIYTNKHTPKSNGTKIGMKSLKVMMGSTAEKANEMMAGFSNTVR